MSNPHAGWYPVSSEPGIIRYWDGDAWTAHRQPIPGTAAASAAAAAQTAREQPVRRTGEPFALESAQDNSAQAAAEQQEARGRAEAQARAQAEAEARAQAEAERRAQTEGESQARAEAERQARAAAEQQAQARAAAEQQARAAAEQQARAQAEQQARAAAEQQARAAAEQQARAAAEAGQRAAEARAHAEAAQRAAEAQARADAEQRARASANVAPSETVPAWAQHAAAPAPAAESSVYQPPSPQPVPSSPGPTDTYYTPVSAQKAAQPQASAWNPASETRTPDVAVSASLNTPTSTLHAVPAKLNHQVASWAAGFGLIVLVFSGVFLSQALTAERTGPGEKQTLGTVVDAKADDAGMCMPLASFTVEELNYVASYRLPAASCTLSVGDTVDVVYGEKSVQATARIVSTPSVSPVLLAFPAAGLLAVVGGVILFLRGGGSVAGVIAAVKSRPKKEKREKSKKK